MKYSNKKLGLLLLIGLFWLLSQGLGLVSEQETDSTPQASQTIVTHSNSKKSQKVLDEQSYYYSKEDVALYIHIYHHLPENYISKQEAEKMNWSPKDKTYVIGGNRFGNREGSLPKKKQRQYYEADLQSGYSDHRGPERIVYSNDGLIFYTPDHYDTFEQLY